MSLFLLCRRQISLQRSTPAADGMGGVARVWSTLFADVPATLLTLHGQNLVRLPRRQTAVSHVVLTPQSLAAELGDRIFDGVYYYQVRHTENLGDRDSGWAVFVERLETQAN